MKFRNVLVSVLVIGSALPLGAQSTSADYSIQTAAVDSGGGITSSTDYRNDSGADASGSLSLSTDYAAKAGYPFQLYDITGLVLNAAAPTVNEGATVQLAAWQLLDDATYLAVNGSSVMWSVSSGPVAGIGANGLATAQVVYADSPATLQGALGGFTGSLSLAVSNIGADDFGTYASDGMDDAWQVQHFGLDNPNAAPSVDFSHTGQTNLFKYIAGLNPTDPNSRFTVVLAPVAGQPQPKAVIFGPLATGRTYTVRYKTDLNASEWLPLTGATFADDDQQRTVIDPAATDTSKFYRVEITKP